MKKINNKSKIIKFSHYIILYINPYNHHVNYSPSFDNQFRNPNGHINETKLNFKCEMYNQSQKNPER